MAFCGVTIMDIRKALAFAVVAQDCGIAEVASRFGVSRPTAYLWVKRAKEEGNGNIAEQSRRPHESPGSTSDAVVSRLLTLKGEHPIGEQRSSSKSAGRDRPLRSAQPIGYLGVRVFPARGVRRRMFSTLRGAHPTSSGRWTSRAFDTLAWAMSCSL